MEIWRQIKKQGIKTRLHRQKVIQKRNKEATTSRNEDKISNKSKVGDGSSSHVKTLTAPIGLALKEKESQLNKTFFMETKYKYS